MNTKSQKNNQAHSQNKNFYDLYSVFSLEKYNGNYASLGESRMKLSNIL